MNLDGIARLCELVLEAARISGYRTAYWRTSKGGIRLTIDLWKKVPL